MPIKIRNPFGKTKKKRKKSKSPLKKLFSSGERKQMSLYKTLRRQEQKATDLNLGQNIKNSFEKFLGSKKKRTKRTKKSKKSKSKK